MLLLFSCRTVRSTLLFLCCFCIVFFRFPLLCSSIAQCEICATIGWHYESINPQSGQNESIARVHRIRAPFITAIYPRHFLSASPPHQTNTAVSGSSFQYEDKNTVTIHGVYFGHSKESIEGYGLSNSYIFDQYDLEETENFDHLHHNITAEERARTTSSGGRVSYNPIPSLVPHTAMISYPASNLSYLHYNALSFSFSTNDLFSSNAADAASRYFIKLKYFGVEVYSMDENSTFTLQPPFGAITTPFTPIITHPTASSNTISHAVFNPLQRNFLYVRNRELFASKSSGEGTLQPYVLQVLPATSAPRLDFTSSYLTLFSPSTQTMIFISSTSSSFAVFPLLSSTFLYSTSSFHDVAGAVVHPDIAFPIVSITFGPSSTLFVVDSASKVHHVDMKFHIQQQIVQVVYLGTLSIFSEASLDFSFIASIFYAADIGSSSDAALYFSAFHSLYSCMLHSASTSTSTSSPQLSCFAHLLLFDSIVSSYDEYISKASKSTTISWVNEDAAHDGTILDCSSYWSSFSLSAINAIYVVEQHLFFTFPSHRQIYRVSLLQPNGIVLSLLPPVMYHEAPTATIRSLSYDTVSLSLSYVDDHTNTVQSMYVFQPRLDEVHLQAVHADGLLFLLTGSFGSSRDSLSGIRWQRNTYYDNGKN